MTLIPSSGPPGTVVTVSGANFSVPDYVWVKFDGTSEGHVYAAGGSWSTSFTVPAVSSDVPHTINAFGNLFAASQPFSVTPRITGNVTSGAVGSAVTLTGAGFAFNENNVTVTFDNQPLDTSASVAAN